MWSIRSLLLNQKRVALCAAVALVCFVIIVNLQFFSFFYSFPFCCRSHCFCSVCVISCACYSIAPFFLFFSLHYTCVYYVIHLFHFDKLHTHFGHSIQNRLEKLLNKVLMLIITRFQFSIAFFSEVKKMWYNWLCVDALGFCIAFIFTLIYCEFVIHTMRQAN